MVHRKTDKEQVIIAKGVGWLFFFFLIDFFSNSNLILLPFISVKREKDNRVREDGIS